ncbi:MAG: DNA-binding protein [Oscillospiraceae bacterium]|nr:DNA-binding protein [Oscillospiraceae bacterium]
MAKNLAISYLLDVYAPVLTDKQREVIELYYYEDLSLAEIAENCGITRQGVRDSIKRGEAVINELEEKLGFAKKLRALSDAADEIRRNASDILLHNSRLVYSEQIRQLAESIIENVRRIDEEQPVDDGV